MKKGLRQTRDRTHGRERFVGTADLMKKGLRRKNKRVEITTLSWNRRPDEEGIKTRNGRHRSPADLPFRRSPVADDDSMGMPTMPKNKSWVHEFP